MMRFEAKLVSDFFLGSRFKIYKNGDIIYTENKGDTETAEKVLRDWLISDDQVPFLKIWALVLGMKHFRSWKYGAATFFATDTF